MEKPEESERRSHSRRRSRSFSSRRRKNWIRPKDYDGTTCVETFLSKFECAAKYNGWDVLDKSAHLKTCLVGAAEHLVWNAEEDTYEDMKQKLRYRFVAEEQQEKFRLELRYRRRKTTETLQELATGVEKLVQLAYPGDDPGLLDILARDSFIDALDDEKLQKEVRRQRPTPLRLALTEAMRLEVLERGTRRSHESLRPRQVRAINTEQGEPSACTAKSRPATEQRTGQRQRGPLNSGGQRGSPSPQKHQPEKRQVKDVILIRIFRR